MKKNRRNPTIIPAVIGMILLLHDPKTALQGAQEGIELCLRTVMPALFPFFILSTVICSGLSGTELHVLKPVCRLCKIPYGAESLMILGMFGGYPVGAQCVYQAYQSGSIDRSCAKRLLGFCNNAGPSFIFGITGALFRNWAIPWSLWFIQILSALTVGALLPGKTVSAAKVRKTHPITFAQALEISTKNMASICGWVIVFRVVISLLKRYFYGVLPLLWQTLMTGILELTNGCVALQMIESEPMRFLLCAIMLSFGGLCVGMQTAVVTKELGTGFYFPGKVLQCMISILLASFMQPLFFSAKVNFLVLLPISVLIVVALILLHKKSSRNMIEAVV